MWVMVRILAHLALTENPLRHRFHTVCGLFFWGFLNFVAGMGLALLGTALWLHEPARECRLHLLAVTVVALLLFVCHMEALALFGLSISCIEVMRLQRRRQVDALTWTLILHRGLRVAVPFVLPALLFLFAAPCRTA
jgi:hypothetical protein